MIIEGRSRGKGRGSYCLASHLLKKENERIRIVETRGTLSHDDLHETLSDWQTIGNAIGCKKALYHANISPDKHQRLTEEQKIAAVDRLEKVLGFSGQPRVVIEHEKKGREHLHVVWLRIDTDRMRVLSDSFNYYKHEKVATQLEQEFGLSSTQRALTREEGQERPLAAPTKDELQQAQRSGITPQEARRQITQIWRRTRTGKELQAALDDAGWVLARGDRRDFVVVDRAGNTHSLARRVAGSRVADIRARFSDFDTSTLPSVLEAREIQKDRPHLNDELAAKITLVNPGIRYGRAARYIEGKRQRRAAYDKGDGDMVTEQRAAMKRFATNSATLQMRQKLQLEERQESAQKSPTPAPANDRYQTTREERAAVEKAQQRNQSDGQKQSR